MNFLEEAKAKFEWKKIFIPYGLAFASSRKFIMINQKFYLILHRLAVNYISVVYSLLFWNKQLAVA
jgi:hypothetical protein